MSETTSGNLSPMLLAYIAGYLDADGCISIYHKSDRGMSKWVSILSISSVDPLIPQLCAMTFGGRVYVHPNPPHRDLHTWKVSHQQAASVAEQLLPYIRLKYAQAQLVVEFEATRIGGKGRPWKLPKEVLDRRLEIVGSIRDLNRVGGINARAS